MNIVVVGNAASGKTTFSVNFVRWLIVNERDACYVNLDPASPLSSELKKCIPLVDIRQKVCIETVMQKYRLGVNGALIKSMELLEKNFGWLAKKLPRNCWNFIDTAGQLEIFTYRGTGTRLIDKLNELERVILIYIVDARDAIGIENFLSILMQNAVVNLKLSRPCITILNKADLLSANQRKQVVECRAQKLYKELARKGERDMLFELAKNLVGYIRFTTYTKRPLLVASKTRTGFKQVYDVMHEIQCVCGEL